MFMRFNTTQEFDEWHTQVNAHFGFPNDNGTQQYSQLVTASDNALYAIIDTSLPEAFVISDVLLDIDSGEAQYLC